MLPLGLFFLILPLISKVELGLGMGLGTEGYQKKKESRSRYVWSCNSAISEIGLMDKVVCGEKYQKDRKMIGKGFLKAFKRHSKGTILPHVLPHVLSHVLLYI